jgi:hypothetical protein
MNSHITARFRASYQALPEAIQRQAREAYRLFRRNPAHPSLRFRQVYPTCSIYSARINIQYCALGIR